MSDAEMDALWEEFKKTPDIVDTHITDAIDIFKSAKTDEERETARDNILKVAQPISGGRRYEAKAKATLAGTQGNLEHYFGKDNVIPLGGINNNFAIKTDKGLFVLEKDDWSPGEFIADLTDIAPELMEGVIGTAGAVLGVPAGAATGSAAAPGPGTVGGGVGGALLGAGFGSMVGRAMRQGMSAATPGQDFASDKEAVSDIAMVGVTDVATGGILKGLGSVIGKAAKRLRDAIPGSAGQRVGEITQELAEQEKITKQRLGDADIDLTKAEQTLDPTDIRIQKAVEEVHPELAMAREQRQATQVARSLQDTYDKIGSGTLTGEDAVKELTLKKQARIKEIQDSVWEESGSVSKQFNDLRKHYGEEPILQSPSAVKFIDEYLTDIGPSAKGVNRLKDLRDFFAEPRAIGEFIRKRSLLSKATKGKGFKYDAESTSNEWLATQIHRRVQQDIDKLAMSSPAHKNLGEANKAYALAMQTIRNEESSALAATIKSVTGNTPIADLTEKELLNVSRLVPKLLSETTTPSKLAEIMREATKVAPEAAKDLQRSTIEFMLKKAGSKQTSMASEAVRSVGAGKKAIDPEKFSKLLLGDEDIANRVKAIVGPGVTFNALESVAKHVQQIGTAKSQARKLSKAEGLIESFFTNIGATRAGYAVGGAGGAGLAAGTVGLGRRTVTRIRYPKRVALALLDPKTALMVKGYFDPPKGTSVKWRRNLAVRLARHLTVYTQNELEQQ